MRMEELVKEMKMLKKKGGGNRFVAFNCMVNLPHMGRSRSSRHVFKFLEIARDSLNKKGSTNSGIKTFGDGLMVGKKKSCGRFSSFLEAHWAHSKALLESMDTRFPVELIEARIAMECLFVAPCISSLACLRRWEENTVGGSNIQTFGLESTKMCENSVGEAKELVKDGQYWLRIEEVNANELMLGYMETPLVRFTSWK